MIELNLLPDVKSTYIKAKRMQRTVVVASALVSAAAIMLFLLLFVMTNVVQKQHLSNLNKDIDQSKKTLQGITDLSKILTVQNQLNKLPDLHGQKPATSRLFGFIQQLTPDKVSVSSLTLNVTEQTMTIQGSAESLAAVNTYVDTLKFTNVSVAPADTAGSADAKKAADANVTTNLAFKEVVLSSFAVSSGTNKGKATTYSIQLKYDPAIFVNNNIATLTVPNKITTRSETEKPTAIFQTQPTDQGGQR